MWKLINTSLFTFCLDPSAFLSLPRITGTRALSGNVFHMPPVLALHSQSTSTFLISPTSNPQTENFSTEPSANSSFPSGRSSHSLSVCTFWGPMMMMYTRLSVLESNSMPVVTVMWYGITAKNRGLIIRKPTHTHFHETSENQGLILSERAVVHAKWVHTPLNSFREGNHMLPWATKVRGRLLSHTDLGLNSARVNFPWEPYWLQGGYKSRFLPNRLQNSRGFESLLTPRDLPEDETEHLNLKRAIRPTPSYSHRSIKANKSVLTLR